MTYTRSVRSLLTWLVLGVLLGGADALAQGRADAAFPDYRHTDMERRLRTDAALPRRPSAAKVLAAQARAKAAVRTRREVELTQAARDLVFHAQDAATGWSKAAAAWAGLSRSWRVHHRDLKRAEASWMLRREAERRAYAALAESAYSLYAAYRSTSDTVRAGRLLIAFGNVQDTREHYVSAELALSAGLGVREDAGAAKRLARIRAEQGFRIAGVREDGDREDPRICLAMSAAVAARHRRHIEDYIVLEPDRGDHPMALRDATVCIGNVERGANYTVAVREGLRDVDGRTVVPGRRTVKVPDRPGSIRFSRGRYVLPAAGSAGLPMTTVNVDRVSLTALRITDGNLVEQVMEQRLGRDLDGYDLRRIAEESGEHLWQGILPIEGARNREVLTHVTLDFLGPERKPGVYVLAATNPDVAYRFYQDRAVQWFVVSDIGLVAMRGADGLSVFARSLATAEPLAGVKLSLQARNEDILGNLDTDVHGRATFAAGLLRGTGGRKAVLLRARAGHGDHTFLSLDRPGFDLSDRGVGGRAAPGPVQAWLYTDRGIYRPGETVHLTALVRDDEGRAIADLPLELAVVRPDGVQARAYPVRSDHTGAIPADHRVSDNAVTGAWRFLLRVPGDAALVGTRSVQVQDFVPPRVEVALKAPESLDGRTPAQVTVSARFLYGAPAAGLRAQGRVQVEVAPEPFAGWSGYRFGPVEDVPLPARSDLPEARTGEDGTATLPLQLPAVVEGGHPLRVRVDAGVLDRGGRAVGATVVLPVRDDRKRIAIRPRSKGTVAVGQAAVFDVAVVDGAGASVSRGDLTWRLYREEREWFQYMRTGGEWAYREVAMDTTVDGGTVATRAGTMEPARITVAPDWGSYRLEVTDPGDAGAFRASVRFRVGWSGPRGSPDIPDMMTVRLDRPRYAPGDTATVRLESPFDGNAIVTVLTDRVAQTHVVRIAAGRATLAIPVERWTAGAYVAATAFRPAPPDAAQGPGRAVGIAWLAVHDPERRLSVRFDAPKTAPSGQTLRVPFQVTRGTGLPAQARVTVAAVDEGILQLTSFEPPDPAAVVFGKHFLNVEMRDLYGRLIDTRGGPKRAYRSGGDGGRLFGGVQPPQKTVALYHGLMRTDAQGRGEVSLVVPAGFSGRLRLMAVAHTKDALGHGHGRVVIRDPLTANLYLPRFLAPGDHAHVTLEMVNHDAPEGGYTPTLTAGGAVTVSRAPTDTVPLAPAKRWSTPVTLAAGEPGEAVLRLAVAGPGGIRMERTWTLDVRPAQAWRQTRRTVTLEPGGSVKLTKDLLEGLYPVDARVSASVSPVPYDVRGVLASLQRYPYGCTEQTISQALPFLYAGETGRGAAWDAGLSDQVQGAVRRVLARQTEAGGFGLWSARDDSEPWVSAYALDFLDRARAKGYEVDAGALRRARSYIAGLPERRRPSDEAWEAYAYGLAVLARSNAVAPGTVRRFIDNGLDKVKSGLGRAQLALAAASFGLAESAQTAFAGVVPALGGNAYLTYGSALRDAAALVAAASVVEPAGLEEAAAHLRRISAGYARASTQEQAWMAMAAWALTRAAPALTVDGAPVRTGDRGFHRTVGSRELEGDGVTLGNPGDRPVRLVITVEGHPMAEEPPHANGVGMMRTFATPAGVPAELDAVRQGDALIVLLEGGLPEGATARRLLVADLLPAGLEIEAAILGDNKEYERIFWEMDWPDALRLRDDRYVAAVNRKGGQSFVLAYVVRAVTPGTFHVPGSYIEDMYDPAVHARGYMQRMTIRR